MATLRQKIVASKLVENGGNIGRAMISAGYAPATAKTPQKLTNSIGWQKLMDKFLPDKKLLQVHQELLDNPDWRARDSGLDKAYKIKGKLGNTQGEKETVSQEIREVIFRIRTILPDSQG
ncbi:MAG: hypothetical protein Q7R97_03175 [Candidatus Daviesbacteria bacterium]|nr:hypothetical protein [Candidatus Daviesbacteria bacterium]